MNSNKIYCQNCLSVKRQFYVYLQCQHFLCLSCSLCLANFQTLQLRCCYMNTKMTQELQQVMFQEIEKRKLTEKIITDESTKTVQQKTLTQHLQDVILQRQIPLNPVQSVYFTQKSNIHPKYSIPSFGSTGQSRSFGFNFKPTKTSSTNQSQYSILKQNINTYQGLLGSNDRILAKLNHQQQKMKQLLARHCY